MYNGNARQFSRHSRWQNEMITNLFINLFIKCHLPLSTYTFLSLTHSLWCHSVSQILSISYTAFHVFRFIRRICVFAIFTAYLLAINVDVSVCSVQCMYTAPHSHTLIFAIIHCTTNRQKLWSLSEREKRQARNKPYTHTHTLSLSSLSVSLSLSLMHTKRE